MVPHGEWQNWLESNFSLTDRTARNFMQCAERFGKTEIDFRFKPTQMIAMLSLPAEETEQFIAEKAAEGKLVLLAEARLGELFNQLPKAHSGGWTAKENLEIPSTRKSEMGELPAADDEKPRPKLEVAARMGFNKNQVADFQRLVDNPDAVQKAIVTAEERASTALAGRNCTSSYRVRGKIRR